MVSRHVHNSMLGENTLKSPVVTSRTDILISNSPISWLSSPSTEYTSSENESITSLMGECTDRTIG